MGGGPAAPDQLLHLRLQKTRRVVFDSRGSDYATIIDVRATESYADSNRKIRGAIHVKLRRLKYRLAFEPLNKISRDSEVVTYCACPNDELSIQAAQMLQESGFKRARVLKGGSNAWLKLSGPVESIAKGM